MTTIERIAGVGAGLVALLALGEACRELRATETPQSAARQSATTPAVVRDSANPFVAHVEHIRPGGTAPRGTTLRNPYAGNAQAIATGARLFISYNCLDCHGAEGSGAMGPSLADGRWHFGGEDSEVFESIYQGRPEGMPAWGSTIAPDQIWMLVSYVKSLSAGKDVSVENFSGKTVERTGH
ncbi:MAG TPA: c-type cytochrome [Gemmatimonadaceae bacterium]|nr:c-type cytochrome [Gemmatimonadaceae bacterium]